MGCTGISLHRVASLALIYLEYVKCLQLFHQHSEVIVFRHDYADLSLRTPDITKFTAIWRNELSIQSLLMHSTLTPQRISVVNISFHCKSSEFSNLTPLPQTPPRWEIVEDQLRVRMTLTSIIPSHLFVAKVQLFQRVRFGREATHGCMAPGLSSAAAVGWTGDDTDSWMDLGLVRQKGYENHDKFRSLCTTVQMYETCIVKLYQIITPCQRSEVANLNVQCPNTHPLKCICTTSY